METHAGNSPLPSPDAKVTRVNPRKTLIWVFVAALAAVLIVLLPLGLDQPGHVTLAIFVFTVVLWIAEVIPLSMSALLWTVLLVVFLGIKTLPAATIFSGFTNSTVWLMVGAFLVGEAMTKTGLAQRIAYRLMIIGGSSYKRVVFFLWVATFVLSLIVPSGTVRMAIMVPIMLGIGAAFGIKINSRFSLNLLLNVYWSSECAAELFLTGSPLNVVPMGVLKTATGFSPSWIGWFVWMVGPVALMSIGVYFIINKIFSPTKEDLAAIGNLQEIQQHLDALGPMSREEWRSLIFFGITLALWVTQPYHKIDSGYVVLMMAALLFLPGIGVLENKDINKIPWNTVLLIGVALGMGAVMKTVKLDTWLISTLFEPILTLSAHLGAMGLTFGVSVFLGLVHFLMPSGVAEVAAMSPLLIKYAVTSGLNASVMGIIAGNASHEMILFPYQSLPLMVLWGTQYMNIKGSLKSFGTIAPYLLVWLILMTPFWGWITTVVRF